MKELVLLALGAAGSLFLLGYSVHMLVGGLVAPTTERWIIAAAVAVGALVVGLMGVDIVRRRRRR